MLIATAVTAAAFVFMSIKYICNIITPNDDTYQWQQYKHSYQRSDTKHKISRSLDLEIEIQSLQMNDKV